MSKVERSVFGKLNFAPVANLLGKMGIFLWAHVCQSEAISQEYQFLLTTDVTHQCNNYSGV